MNNATKRLKEIQQAFVHVLPKVEGLASAYLRMPRSERKDEAIAEVIALVWKAYLELSLKDRDVVKLLGKIVEFAAKKVRCGGRLVGMHSVKDVMSPTARFRHDYAICHFPVNDESVAAEIVDALRDDGDSPALLAAFRVDLEEWLGGLDRRPRLVATQLLSGLNTVEVARLHKVTRTMIYHIRMDLRDDWEWFHNCTEDCD